MMLVAFFFLLADGARLVDWLLLRPLVIRSDMHVHGAVIFFAMTGGIMLFGFAGLAVGPMALTLFVSMARLCARDCERRLGEGPS